MAGNAGWYSDNFHIIWSLKDVAAVRGIPDFVDTKYELWLPETGMLFLREKEGGGLFVFAPQTWARINGRLTRRELPALDE